MTPAALATLRRLRRQGLEAASRALAEAQAAQDEAEAAVRAARRRLDTEREAAEDLAADDAKVEAYAAWLPRGRAALTESETAQARANAATDLARARLAAARIAMEAADLLAERQRQAARDRAARAERETLQETLQRPRDETPDGIT
jgi:flagellar biosynthesis chaperone FliJ